MNDPPARRALLAIPYAVYVVGTVDGDEVSAFCGSLLMQCSFEPTCVALGVGAGSGRNAVIRRSGVFAVSFLAREDGAGIARRFFSPPVHDGAARTLAGIPYVTGGSGAPILAGSPAWFEAAVRQVVEVGDHDLFVADVVAAGPDVEADQGSEARPGGVPAHATAPGMSAHAPNVLTMADTPWTYEGEEE